MREGIAFVYYTGACGLLSRKRGLGVGRLFSYERYASELKRCALLRIWVVSLNLWSLLVVCGHLYEIVRTL